ncbi:alpha/beta hydrolase fold protein [uncultured archaeon]|nr:alpha/beta hydrolase fold protein [uncultured archaeon]
MNYRSVCVVLLILGVSAVPLCLTQKQAALPNATVNRTEIPPGDVLLPPEAVVVEGNESNGSEIPVGAQIRVVRLVLPEYPSKLWGDTRSFTTKDGVILAASVLLPPPRVNATGEGVILVPGRAETRRNMFELAAKISEKGYVVLGLDLRGMGESTSTKDGRNISIDDFTPEEYPPMEEDLAAAQNYLRDVEHIPLDKVHIVGSDVGANLGYIYASKNNSIKDVVMLSPGLNYMGLELIPAIYGYGNKSLLIIVGKDDEYSDTSAIRVRAAGAGEITEVAGTVHGTEILFVAPEQQDSIVRWIMGKTESFRSQAPNANQTTTTLKAVNPGYYLVND